MAIRQRNTYSIRLSSRHRIIGALAFGIVAIAYLFDLGRSPVYFGGDEAHFAIGAHAIATTGRNLNGDRFPLFFNLVDPAGDPAPMSWGATWYHPVLFYLMAVFLKVLPLAEWTSRLPMALVGGVVTPLLTYAVARRMRFDRLPALVAAMAIALAPANVILSRQALDYTCPLPFVLAWLWFLFDYVDTRRVRSAVAIGAILGVGCYSYIAAWAIMPFLLALSWLTFWRMGAGFVRPIAISAAAFAPAILLAAGWLSSHPQMLQETITRYQVLDLDRITDGTGVSQIANVRSTVPGYASYFDPVFLFRRGGQSMTTSTGRMGVFLVPVAIFLPVGLVALIRRLFDKKDLTLNLIGTVLVAGLLFAPLPAALSGQLRGVQRALLLLPFDALISGYGFSILWQSERRIIRNGVIALLILAPIQFAVFYRDYFTHYKFRSAFYYDAVAFADVAQYVMDDTAKGEIYFRRDLDAVGAKWRFYLTKADRRDLFNRTHYVSERADLADAAVGSLLVMYVENTEIQALERSGDWQVEKTSSGRRQSPRCRDPSPTPLATDIPGRRPGRRK